MLKSSRRMDQRRAYLVVALSLLLAASTFALYSPVLHHPFLNFDDGGYVTNNPHVRSGLTWDGFIWAWTSNYKTNWHPLSWLSHALDCQLFGLNPVAHHFNNLLFHVLNVVLFFLFLEYATGATWCSLLAAALFAVHPLGVESVAWIAERKNVLSTFFFLLALITYCWYAVKPGKARYTLMTVLFTMGLVSKPMVTTFPCVVLLLDFWPLGRIESWKLSRHSDKPVGKRARDQAMIASFRGKLDVNRSSVGQLIWEKLPLFALSAITTVITVIAMKTREPSTLGKVPTGMRWANATYAYALYLWKALWPTRLAVFYPRPCVVSWQLLLALLFLGSITVLAWQGRRRHRYLIVGWLWYLGTLAAVIGLIMTDRYTYIPLMGIFIMAVWGMSDVADWLAIRWPWRAAVAALVIAALSFLTWRQVGYWRTNATLWAHTLEITRHNLIAENNLGDALLTLGECEEALPHFQNAAQLNYRDALIHVNIAADLAQCGRLQEAVAEYQKAADLALDATTQARAYESIAILYGALEDYSKVRETYQRVSQSNPQYAEQMIDHLRQGVAHSPTPDNYTSLGLLLQETGKTTAAREAFEQALKLDPTFEEAKTLLRAVPPANQ